MSQFKYQVAPKAGGGYTTRIVLGNPLTEERFSQLVADASGLTPEQCEAAIKATFDTMVASAKDGAWAPSLYGKFSYRPSCGGSNDSPDAFFTPEELNASISVSIAPYELSEWRSSLQLVRTGTVGLLTPVIATVTCQQNGKEDVYLPGTIIRLKGNNLRCDISDESQGVFFKSSDGTEVRGTVYGTNDPSEVSVLVPADSSGPLEVRLAAWITSSIRSYSYTTLLQEDT